MLYVVVPCVGWVTLVISRSSSSMSLSFASTFIWLSVESSGTVALSLIAFGGSFTGVTVMYTVALSVPPLLSVIV
jgi:hypothetical protein